MHRLARIEMLILALTALAVVAALVSAARGRSASRSPVPRRGWTCSHPPARIGRLDSPSATIVAGAAGACEVAAAAVDPAAALLLPAGPVDGVSFAIGVSTLPLAIVVDATLPLPAATTAEES